MNQERKLLCPKLKLFKKGKVREVYDLGERLLIVATDQISAFDVVLPTLISGKGALLTKISSFWFAYFDNEIPHHLITTDIVNYPAECGEYAAVLAGRSALVKKAEMVEVEAIVRGYLSGSGYQDYLKTGEICGIRLPAGMKESAKLEAPLFTPSTKAQSGHDLNVSEEELKKTIDSEILTAIKEKSLFLYQRAAKYALERGIIIADTKFEFGILDGKLILIDEILTPDSSRFWPADQYKPGEAQDSYDKQIIRNYLLSLDWDKSYPGPKLPNNVIEKTIAKYEEVYQKLTA
jgi:phosphoribosylaminoimidazole-succinocarboxamide synthase